MVEVRSRGRNDKFEIEESEKMKLESEACNVKVRNWKRKS